MQLVAAVAVLVTPAVASAIDLPNSFEEAPRGAGTERPITRGDQRVTPGIEGEVLLGSGFTDTYGLGFGGRAGYTFSQGLYVGGAGTYYSGRSINIAGRSEGAYAAFLGAEAGWKLFPEEHWELRPYVFVGPSFVKSVDENTLRTETRTRFGFQPGVLGAYHFGRAYVSAEARAHVTPTPGALTLLAGAGLSF
jgi:hypothetical protein